MNLIEDPWIPTPGGQKSLIDVFSNSEILDVSGDAQVRISLYRLLVTIATRALDLSEEEWDDGEELGDLGAKKCSELALNYLITQKSHFDLLDEMRPWLQMPKSVFPYDKKAIYPIGRLWEFISEGSNASFRSEQQQKNVELSEIALGVLCSQTCSVGYKMGKGSKAYQRPVEVLNVPATPHVVYGGGKYVSGIQHIYLRGNTLIDTIFLNLIPKEKILSIYPKRLGIPFWEHNHSVSPFPEELHDAFYGRMIPAHLKFLRVEDNEVVYAGSGSSTTVWGSENTYHSSVKRIKKDKDTKEIKEVLNLKAIPQAGMFWREIGAILSVATEMAVLDKDKMKSYGEVTIMSLGLDAKEAMGLYQTTRLEDSCVRLSTRDCHDRRFKLRYERSIHKAERFGQFLSKQCVFYAKNINLRKECIESKVMDRYWEGLSEDKERLIEKARNYQISDLEDLNKTIKKRAYEAISILGDGGQRERVAYAKMRNFIRRKRV